jgi:hypothetical protein
MKINSYALFQLLLKEVFLVKTTKKHLSFSQQEKLSRTEMFSINKLQFNCILVQASVYSTIRSLAKLSMIFFSPLY